MSFDLMVFDPGSAPSSKAPFLEWYQAQTEWPEDHGYQDPAVSTPNLRAWFMDMIESFPPLNGPYAPSDDNLPEDEATQTDYAIGRTLIYGCFAWSKADEAIERALELAEKHGLGFFNASSDDEPVWPRR